MLAWCIPATIQLRKHRELIHSILRFDNWAINSLDVTIHYDLCPGIWIYNRAHDKTDSYAEVMIFPNCRGKRPLLPIPATWKQNHYLLYHLHTNKDIKSRCFLPFKPLVFYELSHKFSGSATSPDTCRWFFTGRSDALRRIENIFVRRPGSAAASVLTHFSVQMPR